MRLRISIFWDALMRFGADDGWAIASHIAMSTLIAIFPFLIFVTALAGFFGTAQLSNEAVKIIFDAVPDRVALPIADEVHSVLTQSRSGLLTIGAALALYFASSGVEAVRVGLNRAYDIRDDRPWWLLRLESIVCVLLGALALLTLAFLVILGPLIWAIGLKYLPALEPLGRVFTLSRYAISFLILFTTLVVLHKWLPAKKHRFREIMPGVVLTFVLSVGFGEMFGSYLSHFATNYVSTYAGLASVMIALAFLYTSASIFLYGGELNAAIMRAHMRQLQTLGRELEDARAAAKGVPRAS
jgi:membrane protein